MTMLLANSQCGKLYFINIMYKEIDDPTEGCEAAPSGHLDQLFKSTSNAW